MKRLFFMIVMVCLSASLVCHSADDPLEDFTKSGLAGHLPVPLIIANDSITVLASLSADLIQAVGVPDADFVSLSNSGWGAGRLFYLSFGEEMPALNRAASRVMFIRFLSAAALYSGWVEDPILLAFLNLVQLGAVGGNAVLLYLRNRDTAV